MKRLLSSIFLLSMALIASHSLEIPRALGATGSDRSPERGFIKLPNQSELYVDHLKAKPGHPTLILLNGLTYDTSNWDRLVRRLEDSGLGILRYDMRGMGKTLEKNGPVQGPIPYEAQVEDLKLLIEKVNLERRPTLLGLSYGGGISLGFAKKHGDLIDQAIVVAPYTRPLSSQDSQFKFLIRLEELWTGRQNTAKEFDKRYSALLKANVDNIYPLVEPGNWDKDAVFNLTQGIRKWNAIEDPEIARIPKGKITLIAALFDEYVEYASLRELAEKLGPSLRHFELAWSMHKVPENNPDLMSMIVKETLSELDARQCGGLFQALQKD